MTIICDMKPRWFNINEVQFRKLFLIEKLHYDYKFLSPLLKNVEEKLYVKIDEKIKLIKNNNLKKYTFSNIIKLNENKYCDTIVFSINITKTDNNTSNVVAQYVNHKGELDSFTKKLIEPLIKINIVLDNKYDYNRLYLHSYLSHELTHLIDDYEELIKGNTSLSYKNVTGTLEILRNLSIVNPIFQTIFNIIYTGYKFEKKAFINQSYHELKKVGCTPENYKEKYKETLPYQNYIRMYDKAIETLQNANNNDLKDANFFICTNIKDKNIPRIPVNNFNTEIYRQKLIQLACKTKHDFLKKYGGILTAYLDDYKKMYNVI